MTFTKNAGTLDRALRAIVSLVLIALALTLYRPSQARRHGADLVRAGT